MIPDKARTLPPSIRMPSSGRGATMKSGGRGASCRGRRDYCERWWSGVEPLLAQPVPITIGADEANPVTLSAADWWNVYCDNMQDLRAGKEANATWHNRV